MSGSALIGHTGFVGGALARAGRFDRLVNSTNSDDLRGGSFDLVVCAGVSATKWLANEEPEQDRAAIERLTALLATIRARTFILVSTIDVYPDPGVALDEDAAIDPAANHAYGRHRHALERWVVARFPGAHVVRLSALFGEGLKKNVLFDLLRGRRTDAIDPASMFQWYPLVRLHVDLERVRRHDLRLVNLFPEPVRTAEVLRAFFPGVPVGPETASAPAYRLRTKHAQLFGGPPGYCLDRIAVLGELASFVAGERGGR